MTGADNRLTCYNMHYNIKHGCHLCSVWLLHKRIIKGVFLGYVLNLKVIVFYLMTVMYVILDIPI